MSRKRSSKQLRNIVIAMILLIVFILAAFLIFIFNVDINKSGSSIKDIISSNDNNEEAVVNGVIAPDELAGAEYESVAYDRENTFEIVTLEGKVYLNVLDEQGFDSKYKTSKLDKDSQKEIATHDYKVSEVYVQMCNDREYLLVTMEDGKIGIMDIEEAIEENVFRIKKELITLNNPVSRIFTTYRTFNNKTTEETVLVSANGQMYDLQKFVE